MLHVVWAAELQCIRYRGNEPTVLRRFAEMELRDVCDIDPPPGVRAIIRNHVRFTDSSASVVKSSQLLNDFIAHLKTLCNEYVNYRTRRIKTSKRSSSLEFTWYEKHFHPVIFAEVPESSNDWHIEYPLIGDFGDRGVGVRIFEWLQFNNDRFTNIRWYTDDDWRNVEPSLSTPW
jgi:hypothetical protein